jgi:hypothetical protein
LRKFLLLVCGVALSAGTLAACIGGPPPPPPPPPTDPHDVLVVGDSVAFAFGCALGDSLDAFPTGCPARPGYTTRNATVGACTIWQQTVLLYNGGTAPAPNCDTFPASPENRTWAEQADYYQPKVVVIKTAGWEIVDRWLGGVAGAPDAQWGGSTGGQAYQNAAVYYSAALYNAITNFRARGAKVLVANAPYSNMLQPVPSPGGTTPPGIECSYWEPYPLTPPTAQGEPGNPLTCPGAWRSPPGVNPPVSYRSGRTKHDQFNDILDQVLTNPDPQFGFGSDPNVVRFNFEKHFNRPVTNEYTDWICPPPDDWQVPSVEDLNWHTSDPLDTAFVCDNGNGPNSALNPWPLAINARAPDNGHLSTAGQFDILQPYLEGCVRHLLGLPPPGSAADCA